MTETGFYQKEDGRARCVLCFHKCVIELDKNGGHGLCGTRFATVDGGAVLSPFLGKFCTCAVDPIEKKPLYHWRPKSFIFSLGSVGCNMRCPFCQNHHIAQPDDVRDVPLTELPPDRLVAKVIDVGVSSVAYTYNEPTLQTEYIIEASEHLKRAGIATVLVTNGMFSDESVRALALCTDAMNIDIKTFDARKYAELGGSLEVVKRNVEYLLNAGVHVELTNLVVPGICDSESDFDAMLDWIAGLSADIPLHISRYFPAHKYSAPQTSVELMKKFLAAAESKLKHVHLGNVKYLI